MKKLLSIILALSMLAAFVPAVSAETATQPNFTINYDISGDLAAACGGSAMSAPLNTINLAYTNGFYALGEVGTVTDWATSSDNFKAYGSGAATNIAMRRWFKSAVRVYVPMAGTYTLKVNYATGLAFSQNNMRVYWNTTGGTTDKVGEYKSPEGTYTTDEKWNEQFLKLSPTPFTATVTAPKEGYYYVAFEVDGTGDNVISGLYARASFASISLESGDGNGNAIVLGSIGAPFELKKDETKELKASGYLSKTREAVDFKYISSDNSVATVDENGVVTAVGAGEATITATSKNESDNVTVPLTTKVTVTDPDAYTVTYDVSGIMSKYTMMKASWGTIKLQMPALKYHHTNGFFKYNTYTSHTIDGVQTGITYEAWAHKTMALNRDGSYLSFDIQVPEDGNYKMQMNHDLSNRGGYIDVYVDSTKYGSYNCYDSTKGADFAGARATDIIKTDNGDGTLGDEAVIPLTKGEHTVTFKSRTVDGRYHGSIGTFKLIKGGSDAVKVMHGWATVSNSNDVPVTSLTNGDTATANAAVYTTDGVAAASTTTLTSSNPGVLAVDGTTVTAVGAGEATINATIEYENETYNIESNKILVTDPVINHTVSFYANVHGADDVVLTIKGDKDATYEQDYSYGEIPANTTVTLTAPTDTEGKTFRGWMRGSKDNGVWISEKPEITVTLVSNTFLTAVYDAEVAENEATVEFWNWSGQYLGSKTVDKDVTFATVEKPAYHEPTGYGFAGWASGKDKNGDLIMFTDDTPVSGLTRAVAQFEKTAGKYDVTILDEDVTVVAEGDYEFDTKVTLTSNSGKVYWLRDGKTVDYGETYSFYVWDNTVITTSKDGNSAPKVILDKHADYETYMIEFDKGEADNMRILEAGILFGNDPKVDRFGSKAVASGRDLNHGQFTAKPNSEADATNAVGYIVYLDGGIARVLYAYDN